MSSETNEKKNHRRFFLCLSRSSSAISFICYLIIDSLSADEDWKWIKITQIVFQKRTSFFFYLSANLVTFVIWSTQVNE